jgi:hypothetical protein
VSNETFSSTYHPLYKTAAIFNRSIRASVDIKFVTTQKLLPIIRHCSTSWTVLMNVVELTS